jgi:act minimal PKS acyl carrier protein
MTFTVAELRRILLEGAGDDGGITEESLDVPFEEIGFESLQLLEATVLIQASCGVDLDDSVLTTVYTPRELIDTVNSRLVSR